MVRIPTHGPPTHPGEILLEEFLKPIGLSQTELAEKMGVSYPRVNELIHGKRGVTPDTALRLEKLFGMEAQFWLNLQLAWDLYHATHSPAAKNIRKIKCLIPGARLSSSKINTGRSTSPTQRQSRRIP
ncbi:MAG: addiction module antidote protein, HigA family [Deltaproteobacteria bacterium]|nr:MAG: addiction module antidote protein, HigA family [Deltaproteobacteria bacterium]